MVRRGRENNFFYVFLYVLLGETVTIYIYIYIQVGYLLVSYRPLATISRPARAGPDAAGPPSGTPP